MNRLLILPRALPAFLALLAGAAAWAADPVVDRWLAAQTNLTAWSASFVQTRSLKALARPLTTTGRVVFQAPDSFRWELGEPPASIAVRRGDALTVLSPRLRRAERYSLSAAAQGPMKEAMALLDTGFPRTAAEFEQRFRVLSVATNEARLVLRLEPRTAAARRLLPEIGITLTAASPPDLLATELRFPDGSTLRNDFTNAVRNPSPDASLFDPTPPAGYTEAPSNRP